MRAVRVAAVLAAIVLAALGWYLASPLFIRTTMDEAPPTPIVAGRATPSVGASAVATPTGTAAASAPGITVLRRGQLQYVDRLHNGTGAVLVLAVDSRLFLRFEGVAITNAPDVHVYLAQSRGGEWSEQHSTYVGPLKATNGSFNYDLPAHTDLAAYGSVVVWCRAFSVLVTWADLDAP